MILKNEKTKTLPKRLSIDSYDRKISACSFCSMDWHMGRPMGQPFKLTGRLTEITALTHVEPVCHGPR